MKNKIIPLLLSASLIIAFPCSSYATEIVKPEKPNINNEQQVNEYNEQVDKYNQQVDLDYEEQVNNYNQAIEHNKQEEIKVQENEQAIQQYEKDLKQYQQDLKQYEEDQKQYEKDLKQYEIDKKYEQAILNLGYESVEAYNNYINTTFNEPAKKSIEKNTTATPVTIETTYVVQEAVEKAEESIKVFINHIFEEVNIFYSTEITIDKNDAITFFPISTFVEQTVPNWASFYYKTDKNHVQGYWVSSSVLQTAAKIQEDGWNAGDTHTVSFANGKLHINDPDDIIMDYYYFWIPLYTYKTYNIPAAPAMPVEPTAPAFVEKYIPNFFNLTIPIKKEYLQKLTFIPIVNNTTIATTNRNNTLYQKQEEIKKIKATKTPTSKVSKEYLVPEHEVPLGTMSGKWALLNLIITICSVLLTIISFILFFHNRKKEKEKEEYIEVKKKSLIKRFCAIFISLILIIIFILTEDMTLPMTWTDKYTILMLFIFFIHVTGVMVRKKKEKEEKKSEGRS